MRQYDESTRLGLIVINGMWRWGETHRFFGYFHGEHYGHLLNQYLGMNQIPYSEISGFIHPLARGLLGYSMWISGNKKSRAISLMEKSLNKESNSTTVVFIIIFITLTLLFVFGGK